MKDVFEENNYDLMESYAKYYQRECKLKLKIKIKKFF
jgi:hypothetical protein